MRIQQKYNVGIYCRLSRDDNNGNSESMSIGNQKQMLIGYAEERGWKIQDTYCDDGISGTTFERPEFKRMIADIETGKIDCVLSKDLSRLGRNYVMTGQYTDFFFPKMGVRYIAVNDNYDTMSEDNDIAPFKNILNEMYAKDISKKVRSSRKTSAKQGKFMGSKPPYGYVKSPTNKYQLVIDPEAAIVVKRIFNEYANGDSGRNIAIRLNAENVDSPRTYHYKKIGRPNPNPAEAKTWGSTAVMQILKNPVYIGHMVQGKRQVTSFKTKQREFIDPENWIIVENTHEPIVDMETWERVKTRLDGTKSEKKEIRRNSKGEISLFSGIIRCADCGSAMSYTLKKYRGKETELYRCSRYMNYGKAQCSTHTILMETLKSVVLADIRHYAAAAVKDEEKLIKRILSSSGRERNRERNVHKAKLQEVKKRIADIDDMIKKLFEEKFAGNVPESIFKKLMHDYEAEQVKLSDTAAELESKLDNAASIEDDVTKWIELIKQCVHIDTLDRTTAFELIDTLEVSEVFVVDGQQQQNIRIKYKFVGFIATEQDRICA